MQLAQNNAKELRLSALLSLLLSPCVEHVWTSGLVGLKMLKYGSEWYRCGYRLRC